MMYIFSDDLILSFRIHNETEFDFFSQALTKLGQHLSKDDMFLPLKEEGECPYQMSYNQ